MNRIVLIVTALAATCSAQPRAVDVWGTIGVTRAAGDEGSIGSAATVGAGVTAPITEKIAVEADIQRLHAGRFPPGETRIFVSPALIWRFGGERLYGFTGGGPGLQVDRGRVLQVEPRPGQQPIVTESSFTNFGLSLHGRGGIVANPTGRLIVRAELFFIWHYVLPTVGARFGAGYRF
jgi:hypothetical protein